MASKLRLKRHVNYVSAAGRMRSGTITAIATQNQITIRVAHKGETHAGINRHVTVAASGTRANKFRGTA